MSFESRRDNIRKGHHDTEHNDIQHNGTQHNNKENVTPIITLSIMIFNSCAECRLYLVTQSSLLC